MFSSRCLVAASSRFLTMPAPRMLFGSSAAMNIRIAIAGPTAAFAKVDATLIHPCILFDTEAVASRDFESGWILGVGGWDFTMKNYLESPSVPPLMLSSRLRIESALAVGCISTPRKARAAALNSFRTSAWMPSGADRPAGPGSPLTPEDRPVWEPPSPTQPDPPRPPAPPCPGIPGAPALESSVGVPRPFGSSNISIRPPRPAEPALPPGLPD